MDVSIEVEGLGKRYRVSPSGGPANSLRDAIAECARSFLHVGRIKSPRFVDYWALRDVNLRIHRGERVGIIGLNGAGKSTLLKVLSRIVEPTTGIAKVCGRVGALLEVGTGFHWELTGRENVYLYGAILGMSRSEMNRKFEAIVEFSGVKEFIDVPVKRYSSGMYVRLAFAVAAHLEPEILFIDEVLSVGDLPFQRKCIEYARGLQNGGATILFVSHNMFSIKTMCERAIYIKQGGVVFDGPIDRAIEIYEEDCRLSALPWIEGKLQDLPVEITGFSILDKDLTHRTLFDYGEIMRMRLTYHVRGSISQPNFIVAFIRSDGVACCNYSSLLDGASLENLTSTGFIELAIPPIKLVAGMYTVHIIVRENGFDRVVGGQIGSTFHVRHALFDHHFGVFHEGGKWTHGIPSEVIPVPRTTCAIRGNG